MLSKINGVSFRSLGKHNDDRGWLMELYRHDELAMDHFPVMAYVSETNPGVMRGPHEHVHQTDYFAFIGPGDFDLYLWDNRIIEVYAGIRMGTEKRIAGTKEVYRVGVSNPCAVIIPPGVVHGYKNVSEDVGWVFNAANRLYAGPGKKYPVDEIRHEEQEDTQFSLKGMEQFRVGNVQSEA